MSEAPVVAADHHAVEALGTDRWNDGNGPALAASRFGACDMADVILAKCGIQRRTELGPAHREAQESDEGGQQPDIKRPPDQDLPDIDEEMPEIPDGPGSPPFTGEDDEDVGPPKKRDRPTPM